jgi:hypothetical protein
MNNVWIVYVRGPAKISTAQFVQIRAQETKILREYKRRLAESTLIASSQELIGPEQHRKVTGVHPRRNHFN